MEDRKKDHIERAFQSQTGSDEFDRRFWYDPMLSAKPAQEEIIPAAGLAGKKLRLPVWISSMTGGTRMAGHINHNLARACREFGMGMGLGSCRIILEDDRYLPDFDVRDTLGDDLPLFANIGIAQLEKLIAENRLKEIDALITRLRADGLVVHVNPFQEWFQPEGDRLFHPPIDSIRHLVDHASYPVIVKEVGQGMGYGSLRALLQLPIEAIEFAAFGGTNFSKLELMRASEPLRELHSPLSRIGQDAPEMLSLINEIYQEDASGIKCQSLIISGGIKTFLDGYYLTGNSYMPAIYGQASAFLKHARGEYEQLREFVNYQRSGLRLAHAYLRIRRMNAQNNG